MTMVLKTRAIGLGTTFVAPKKAKGIANTAPTKVPKNAMQRVSKSRYGTPSVVRLNNRDEEGWNIPLIMDLATAHPSTSVPPLFLNAVLDQAIRNAIITSVMTTTIHNLGLASYISWIVIPGL